MANLPSPTKVAGQFLPQYEIYWKRLDPQDSGQVAPMDAAKFLKLSGLNDHTLGKIWDLSDPDCRGYLDKAGFFTAIKLVALSQANRELLVECILEDLPAPNFGDQTAPGAKVAAAPRGTPAPSVNFLVKPDEKRKYDALFDQLKPQAGLIPGDKVRNVMLGSKLPMSMLGKIWDLADQDKDGNLDRYEFTVAMHLVYRALQDDMIPDQLPGELSKEKVPLPLSAPIALPELHNGATPRLASVTPTPDNNNSVSLTNLNTLLQSAAPSKPHDPPAPLPSSSSSVTQPILPALTPTLPTLSPGTEPLHQPADPTGIGSVQAVPWVVNAGDRLRYEALFKQTDNDKDGFVSGVEIKNLFLQTGLPQNILAHIWNLSDMKQEGKLNPEQFALAMYLVQQKQAGKDPPAALTPDMVPPSMRPKGGAAPSSEGQNRSVYNNPELEAMAKEIQELLQEKMLLEREVQETQYNIQARQTESHSLQSEFETLNTTLTQLTNQRNVAQKRLDDLDSQRDSMRTDLSHLTSSVEEENQKIGKLRSQADEQEASLKAQEDEVNNKKLELEVLIAEETSLNNNITITNKEINTLIKTLNDIEYLLGETTGRVSELEEAENHMVEANKRFDKVMESDDPSEAQNVPDLYLEPIRVSLIEPDYSRIDKPARPPPPPAAPEISSPVLNGGGLTSRDDPFSDMSPETRDPSAFFSNDDAFASFSNNQSASAFGAFDPFSSKPSITAGFKSPFSSHSNAFNFDGNETPPVPAPRPGDSPTPALPPKNQAAPPKRPPPPRRPPPPKAAPAMAEPVRPPPPKLSPDDDPFGEENAFKATTNGGDSAAAAGFADFGAFDESSFKKNEFNQFPDNSSAWNDPPNTLPSDSSKGRYAGGLDFYEDPFKNSNVRYGDPFDLETPDPFAASAGDPSSSSLAAAAVDPFADSTNVFGSDPFANNSAASSNAGASSSDPFGQNDAFGDKSSSDFFAAKPSDPFGGSGGSSAAANSTLDPFGVRPLSSSSATAADPFGGSGKTFGGGNDPFASDPFGASKGGFSQTDSGRGTADPFGSGGFGGNSSLGLGSAAVDPFTSNSSNFGNDPFSLTTLTTLSSSAKEPGLSSSSSTNQPTVSSTPSTLSYRKEKHSSSSSETPGSSKKKHGHGLTDFLTGSPLSKSEKKKDKKHGKFHLSSPLKTRSKESPKSEKKSGKEAAASAVSQHDQAMIKMAAEMSKREDSERQRRLQLQEEQELAYAIALSKAEAASLNQQ